MTKTYPLFHCFDVLTESLTLTEWQYYCGAVLKMSLFLYVFCTLVTGRHDTKSK